MHEVGHFGVPCGERAEGVRDGGVARAERFEVDDGAACIAAKAVEPVLRGVDVQRRSAVCVEGAAHLEVSRPGTMQRGRAQKIGEGA